MRALEQIEEWPAPNVAAAVVRPEGVVASRGDARREFRWASVTKLVTAVAVLVAAEEGTVDLDEPAGPPASTVRHLLAHSSGLPFEGRTPISRPGERRIYSNTGFDMLAETLAARAEMPFAAYLRGAVLEPLGLQTELRGSAGAGLNGTLADAVALARELVAPRRVAAETFSEATPVAFPGIAGVLPDWGRFEPNDWGLGFELKDGKAPHWSGSATSARTFGHFGGSGTFLWVDPELRLACVCLTDLEFGPWAKDAWPAFSDAVVAEAGHWQDAGRGR